jgi:hypothetical protein
MPANKANQPTFAVTFQKGLPMTLSPEQKISG